MVCKNGLNHQHSQYVTVFRFHSVDEILHGLLPNGDVTLT